MGRRRRGGTAPLLALAVLLIAGCGDDDDSGSARTPTPTTGSSATATGTVAPTPTASAVPTRFPTRASTATTTPSHTATATATPTPTVTPTATSTATLTPLDPSVNGSYGVGSTSATFVRPSTTTGEPRALATIIWYPAPSGTTGEMFVQGVRDAPLGDGGPFPLLVFSHGSCGLPQQSTFLTTRLASYGFIVAAPPHPGNTLLDGPPTRERCLGPAFLLDSFLNRADDVVFVIDRMLALSAGTTGALVGAIDDSRIGVLGHSFGGQTVLRVPAAAPRVGAVLSLAPGRSDLVLSQVDQIDVPTMIQGGEIDSVAPFDVNCVPAYEHLRRPRFLLEILNTGHFAFSNVCLAPTGTTYPDCAAGTLTQAEANAIVVRFAVPFFGFYLGGEPRWATLLEAGSAPAGVVYTADP